MSEHNGGGAAVAEPPRSTEPTHAVDLKQRVIDRLRSMEALEGVLPTPPVRSTGLDQVAREFSANDIGAAIRNAGVELRQSHPNFKFESAAALLTGSSGLREQMAGFAAAGINLFHASKDFLNLSLDGRRNIGANGMVSRVLVSEQRILLETPRHRALRGGNG